MSKGQDRLPNGQMIPKTPPVGNRGNADCLPHDGDKSWQADGKPNAVGVSIDKYNNMTKAYFDVQTVDHVAKTCQVKWHTARKYIERGDPKRGMRAIRERFIEAQHQVQKKEDRTWAKAREEWKVMLLAAKSLLNTAIKELVNDKSPAGKAKLEAFIDRLKADPVKLGDMVSKLMRDESFIYDGADSRVDIKTHAQQVMETWTPEELVEYVETGKRPDRLVPMLTRDKELK